MAGQCSAVPPVAGAKSQNLSGCQTFAREAGFEATNGTQRFEEGIRL